MRIALLHALPLDERMWEPQLAALDGHQVHAPRLYPLGETIDEWALGVLQQVPGRLVAVGASMGGYCASAIARLAPERLEAIVLAASRPDADPPERQPVRAQGLEIVRERGAAGFWDEVARGFLAEDADPATVDRARRIALEQSADDLARAIVAIRDRRDSTEAVTSGIPLLVVAGDRDFTPVSVFEGIAAAASGGRFELIEGSGHLPSLERPGEFNRILTAFLSEL